MLPSKTTIQKRFPHLTAEEVKNFRKTLENYENRPERCLKKIDKILEGCGVEYTQEAVIESYHEFNGIEYVNMGDSYITTLIYDHRLMRYYISSWGDYIEWRGNRF